MPSRTYGGGGWLRTKPARPYNNLADFVEKNSWFRTDKYTARKWPCLECRGRGWVYDPEDPPCPVEGNRDRRTLKCITCGGTGEGTKAACIKAYREAIQRFKAEADDYKRLSQVRKELQEGLSQEQIRAIRELGI